MSDTTKADATSADDASQDTNDQTTRDQQQAHDDDTTGLGDAGKAALKREREAREAAEKARKDTEKQLRDVSKRLKDIEDAGKTESEKIAAERDALREKVATLATKARDGNGREAVRAEAIRIGADPRRVDRIVRLVRPDLAYDEDDEPTNVKKLLADLKVSDADLFQPVPPGKGDAGAGGGSKPQSQGATAALRAALGRSG